MALPRRRRPSDNQPPFRIYAPPPRRLHLLLLFAIKNTETHLCAASLRGWRSVSTIRNRARQCVSPISRGKPFPSATISDCGLSQTAVLVRIGLTHATPSFRRSAPRRCASVAARHNEQKRHRFSGRGVAVEAKSERRGKTRTRFAAGAAKRDAGLGAVSRDNASAPDSPMRDAGVGAAFTEGMR